MKSYAKDSAYSTFVENLVSLQGYKPERHNPSLFTVPVKAGRVSVNVRCGKATFVSFPTPTTYKSLCNKETGAKTADGLLKVWHQMVATLSPDSLEQLCFAQEQAREAEGLVRRERHDAIERKLYAELCRQVYTRVEHKGGPSIRLVIDIPDGMLDDAIPKLIEILKKEKEQNNE